MREGTGSGGRCYWISLQRKTPRVCFNVVSLYKRKGEKHKIIGNSVRAFQSSRAARFLLGLGLEHEIPGFVGSVLFCVAQAHNMGSSQHPAVAVGLACFVIVLAVLLSSRVRWETCC